MHACGVLQTQIHVRAMEAARRQDPDHRARVREYQRVYRLFTKYGITLEECDARFQQQNGRCAICKERPSKENTRSGVLHVDHDHTTGKIRALLCFLCNTLLGSARDDISRLDAARAYLIAHATA